MTSAATELNVIALLVGIVLLAWAVWRAVPAIRDQSIVVGRGQQPLEGDTAIIYGLFLIGAAVVLIGAAVYGLATQSFSVPLFPMLIFGFSLLNLVFFMIGNSQR
ncbi:MAG: hypothetical protein U0528_15890 [Anaerolineae bacterium]|nr:hypothetical protein [Anaerolineae bacterium]